MSNPIDLEAIKANIPKPCHDRKYTNDIGQVLFTADQYCAGCGHERGLPHRRDCPATNEVVSQRRADEAVAVAKAIGVFALIAEVERLRADLDRALTDGVASHGRYLAADSDYRHQSEKAARHWQERCQAITERNDARLALAMARGEGWPEEWEWSESDEGYQSPADDAYIRPKTVNHLGPKGMEGAPLGWSLYRRDKEIRGMSRGDKVTYPDALTALRAYQAMVTP